MSLSAAVVGTLAAALLYAAATQGIWMRGAYLHPTPRINAMTVGYAAAAAAAVAWIVFLWARRRLSGAGDVALRALISVALLLAAAYCAFSSMFLALFVG